MLGTGTNRLESKLTSITKNCEPLTEEVEMVTAPAFGFPSIVRALQQKTGGDAGVEIDVYVGL